MNVLKKTIKALILNGTEKCLDPLQVTYRTKRDGNDNKLFILRVNQGWGTFLSSKGHFNIYNIICRPYKIIYLKLVCLILFSPCFSLCSCLLWFFYDITDMTLICQRTSRVNFFNLFLRHLFINFFVGISVCTSNRRRKTSCCLTKSWATTLDWQRRWHTMTIWKQCRPSNISHILTTILRFLK